MVSAALAFQSISLPTGQTVGQPASPFHKANLLVVRTVGCSFVKHIACCHGGINSVPNWTCPLPQHVQFVPLFMSLFACLLASWFVRSFVCLLVCLFVFIFDSCLVDRLLVSLLVCLLAC